MRAAYWPLGSVGELVCFTGLELQTGIVTGFGAGLLVGFCASTTLCFLFLVCTRWRVRQTGS